MRSLSGINKNSGRTGRRLATCAVVILVALISALMYPAVFSYADSIGKNSDEPKDADRPLARYAASAPGGARDKLTHPLFFESVLPGPGTSEDASAPRKDSQRAASVNSISASAPQDDSRLAASANGAGKRSGDDTREHPAARGTWPLLNLIFMIAGAALGISAIVTRGKKNGRDMSGEFMNWDEKHYGVWKPNETAHEENKRLGKEEYPAGIYKTSIKIVAICAATTGVIVWCVTQKITGRMVTSDEYTLVQGAIAAAAGVSFILCGIERKGPDKYEYKNDLQAEFTNKKQKFL